MVVGLFSRNAVPELWGTWPANPTREASRPPEIKPSVPVPRRRGLAPVAAWLSRVLTRLQISLRVPGRTPAFTHPPFPSLPVLCRRALIPFFHCHRQRLIGCVVKILGSINASARH